LFRKWPDIFVGLVLANTRASADDEASRLIRLNMIQNLTQTKDPRPIYEQHLTKFFTSKTRHQNRQLIEFTQRMMHECSISGIISAQQAMASRSDAFDLLSGMKFPVLLIAGSKDELTTIEDAKRMADNLPDSELKIIDDAAHLSNLEKPELFNLFLAEYLEKLKVTKSSWKK
jgi:pimeloyl-ACP methyl ester carboxylesterase